MQALIQLCLRYWLSPHWGKGEQGIPGLCAGVGLAALCCLAFLGEMYLWRSFVCKSPVQSS